MHESMACMGCPIQIRLGPILRNWREAPAFNAAWFKQRKKLNLLQQRIRFLIFSLASFKVWLFIERLTIGFARGHRFDLDGAVFVNRRSSHRGLFFLVSGVARTQECSAVSMWTWTLTAFA